jgi:chromosome partitioning protein
MRTITIAGRKGGTGKTTTSVNVAGWLAKEGRRVLLIDFDPQGNASTALAVPTDGSDVWRLLVRQDPLPELAREVRPGLDILAGGEQTAVARDVLAVQSTRDARVAMYALRDALARDAVDYDFILIDCPPSLDLLAVNAVLAAAELALPVPCQYLGAEGARQFVDLAAELADTAGGRADLTWVIPTFYRSNVTLSQEILDALREAFDDRVTDPVRLTVRLDEAAQQGKLIFEYEPSGNGAADYAAVARRIDYGR